MLVNLMGDADLEKINKTFEAIDLDHSGSLSISEILRALKHVGYSDD